MAQSNRTRELVILTKGRTFTPVLGPAMVLSGWRGGQGVRWISSSIRDEFIVELADGGDAAAFMIYGSDEPSDQYTSMTLNQVVYAAGTMMYGRALVETTTYEHFTYVSRTGPGPLVPIVYAENEPLLFSLRGYWTTEDEWSLSGDLRAPNEHHVGLVVKAPSTVTSDYLAIQVNV